MKAFLKILAEFTLQTFREEKLEDLCFIFPNRRSGTFFKHYLVNSGKGNFWLPEVMTINEFMTAHSGLEPADPIDVSFELYRIYRHLAGNPEGYDEFYYWGEMLISDFDDLDKYLVPAEKLFQNIIDLKEIDSIFSGFDPEQLKIIREFWAHFEPSGLSSEKKNFLEMWKIMYPLYIGINKALREKGTGYEGMLYREVATSVKSNSFGGFTWDKIIVAGFNALNNAERALFNYLKQSGKGLFFWDYDDEYINNQIPEAGRFLRKNLTDFPPSDFGESFNHLSKTKNIHIFDLPSDPLQAKQLGKLLDSSVRPELQNFDNTAVILGDETLLEPVLSSIPEKIPHVNITMGYPLSHTPVFSFTDHLLKLQKNINHQVKSRSGRFYYQDVLNILNHQYIRMIIDKEAGNLLKEINSGNMIYINPSLFAGNNLLDRIFRKVENALEMSAYLREILESVMEIFQQEEEAENRYNMEKEYTWYIISRINKLESIFSKDPPDTGIDTFARLFRKVISKSRIPFQGEPLQGLQIMGILESRLLDFENIIFLSMNEGVMPGSHAAYSFIPPNLRYAFGMPGREDHDAIYAYYFYRLIQRADNISILYNSKSEGIRSGEKSRYLYQLEYLSEQNPVFKTIAFHITDKKAKPLTITKSDDSLRKLNEYSDAGIKGLSPTAINTWLDCRLKFYLTYIAGLREDDEAGEDIDAPMLGNILHEAMRHIYREYEGKLINEEVLQKLSKLSHVEKCLKEAFRIRFFKSDKEGTDIIPEGRNIIVYEVIKKLIFKILEKDGERIPFTIAGLEKKYESFIQVGGINIRLAGTIDRVDINDGKVMIFDYKTGKVDMRFESLDGLFDPEDEKRNRSALQTMIYSYLYSKVSKKEQPVQPCLISTRNLFKSDFTYKLSIKSPPPDSPEIVSSFEPYELIMQEKLSNLISELFNPDIPFTQTRRAEICAYCDFREICHRDKPEYTK